MELKLRIAVEGDLLSGKPTMVIIVNEKKRINYDGNMTLDTFLGKCGGQNAVENSGYKPIMSMQEIVDSESVRSDRRPGDIHKRDTVRCVKANPREGGIPLVLGAEYSVLAKEGGMYVLFGDDGRVYAKDDEIEFVRSNPPVTHIKREMEETKICEKCGEVFVGYCECAKVAA